MKLLRYYQDENMTLGLIKYGAHPPIYTLELPWRNNQKRVSCIPEGTYTCKPHNGPKYPDTYEVCDVENRTAILIHVGNWPKDTLGCILPGFGVSYERQMVQNSYRAMEEIKGFYGKQEFEITIESI